MVLVVIALFVFLPRSPLPSGITKQAHFAIFTPATDQATIQSSSVSYDSSQALLTYVSTMPNGTKLTFSEQATPEGFSDIPQAYDKLVEQMGRYATIDTVNGKVYLTKQPKAGSNQVAALNDRGTLLFVRSSKDLSEDQWRQLFNSMALHK